MSPKDVRAVISCEYVIRFNKRDFADVIKVRILRWGGYPGLSGQAQCDREHSFERKARVSESEKGSGRHSCAVRS